MAARALHSPTYRPLCRLLRQWREAAGLSQKDLAQRLGRVPSWVHKCEVAERRVDPTELIAWCRETGVEPADAIRQIEKAMGGAGRAVASKDRRRVR